MLAQPAVGELIALMKGPELARMLKPVAGYRLDNPREVVTLDAVFPWISRAASRGARS